MALLALSVAIGANAVIFGVVQGVLLRPLPFPDVERLFLVFEAKPAAQREIGIRMAMGATQSCSELSGL